MFSLFLSFNKAFALDAALLQGSGMQRAHIYTPAAAQDPFLDDGAAPPLVLQLYFQDLARLERACGGPLRSLEGRAQAMAVRRFELPDPGVPGCTYLVAYEGPAQDEHAWHEHYLEHHPPLMARLPRIRELEVYTRVDWVAPRGWQRAHCMQRNKVAFDSPQALTAALASPVREEMRRDYQGLPAFRGGVSHYAMATRLVLPG